MSSLHISPSGRRTYHIAMYPWFALGHQIAFFRLANKIATKGHKISFFAPKSSQLMLHSFNHHPHLISFVPVAVPHVPGLPAGAETTADVPSSAFHLLMEAMDMTQDIIETELLTLKPDMVFFDFTHWIPAMVRRIGGGGMRSVCYRTVSPAMNAYAISPERILPLTEADMMEAPPSYPEKSITLRAHEARAFTAGATAKFGGDISFFDRLCTGFRDCDAIAYSTCRELEGPFCDYMEAQYKKPVLLAGPALPVAPPSATVDKSWSDWLGKFKKGSVIYCAFGSECILKMDQFQELLWGLELTGMPFFAALKTPSGADSIEAAIPEELKTKLHGRGIVCGKWVEQQLFLQHPSVGCFVTHCGWASLSEALVSECQIVLLPHAGDQIINAKIMSLSLRVGVEVEKGEEDGLFTREGVCRAVRGVMDEESETGRETRANHDRLRELLLNKDLESNYIELFNEKLHALFS